MHSNSGVEKGMKAGGKPVEVMGLILGRPDTEQLTTLVVTDVSKAVSMVMSDGWRHDHHVFVCATPPPQVFPLPVEGAETKVLANDDEVINYMIKLSESLETVSGSPHTSSGSIQRLTHHPSC